MTLTMYDGMVNSPQTTLVTAISALDVTITVVDGSVLPAAPNIATIGTGEDAETIKYTGNSGNILTGVERGFEGTAKMWGAGEVIKREFTNYDYDAMRNNLVGEANTASNLGTGSDGEGLSTTKSGVDLPFKRIKAGTNITLTPETNDVKIDAACGAIHDYIRLPASAWTVYTPLSMGGTGAELVTEKLSNGVERTYLGYGDASVQYAYAIVKMPPDWNGGNLKLQLDWETSVATAAAIKMDITGDRIADAGTSNVALTTALISITDTNTGANLENQSAETADFTIAGSGNKIRLRLSRDITDALTADIKAHDLTLNYIRTLV